MENTDRPSFKGRRGKQRTVEEKFWDYVIIKDGCWGWRGGYTNYGYPQMAPSRGRQQRLSGKASVRSGPLRGHRVSWEIHNGKIPEGMNVLHHCDNAECSNPKHLYLGTQSENMQDAWDRGRRKPKRTIVNGKVVCKYGHEKELLPNETEKYVCRVCMNNWRFKNPEKYAVNEVRRKKAKRA